MGKGVANGQWEEVDVVGRCEKVVGGGETYRMMPADQMSDLKMRSEADRFDFLVDDDEEVEEEALGEEMSSGAWKAGEPMPLLSSALSFSFGSDEITSATPKSPIFNSPDDVNSRLSGLISR